MAHGESKGMPCSSLYWSVGGALLISLLYAFGL